MTEKQQQEVFDKLMGSPVRNFGFREINILYGGSREIEESIGSRGGRHIYKMNSSGGSMMFYFNGNEVSFIG